ncbi:hypothetical protein B0J18DRAFT_39678 [Chaetomium sp. MPI-SDFR-AT-0129]|nr:hypothetical protein B0J18DRAFT_39678 [Chaetomium sp. MPI-SDFR-AT-0129]
MRGGFPSLTLTHFPFSLSCCSLPVLLSRILDGSSAGSPRSIPDILARPSCPRQTGGSVFFLVSEGSLNYVSPRLPFCPASLVHAVP